MWRFYGFVLLGLVFGSNGYPNEDLVVRLPGQPKVNFKQFAGYVDVDVKNGRSLFYYFVESEEHSDHKPLTLWLNGGLFFGFVFRFFFFLELRFYGLMLKNMDSLSHSLSHTHAHNHIHIWGKRLEELICRVP